MQSSALSFGDCFVHCYRLMLRFLETSYSGDRCSHHVLPSENYSPSILKGRLVGLEERSNVPFSISDFRLWWKNVQSERRSYGRLLGKWKGLKAWIWRYLQVVRFSKIDAVDWSSGLLQRIVQASIHVCVAVLAFWQLQDRPDAFEASRKIRLRKVEITFAMGLYGPEWGAVFADWKMNYSLRGEVVCSIMVGVQL